MKKVWNINRISDKSMSVIFLHTRHTFIMNKTGIFAKQILYGMSLLFIHFPQKLISHIKEKIKCLIFNNYKI